MVDIKHGIPQLPAIEWPKVSKGVPFAGWSFRGNSADVLPELGDQMVKIVHSSAKMYLSEASQEQLQLTGLIALCCRG